MALKLGPLKIPWPGKDPRDKDPYWDFFINTPPADLANTVTDMMRGAPEGNIFPTKADLHTPEITSATSRSWRSTWEPTWWGLRD